MKGPESLIEELNPEEGVVVAGHLIDLGGTVVGIKGLNFPAPRLILRPAEQDQLVRMGCDFNRERCPIKAYVMEGCCAAVEGRPVLCGRVIFPVSLKG